jgi:hypothetical protein
VRAVIEHLFPHLVMAAMGAFILAIVLAISSAAGKSDDPAFQSSLALTLVGAVPLILLSGGALVFRRRLRAALAQRAEWTAEQRQIAVFMACLVAAAMVAELAMAIYGVVRLAGLS